jgi:hypothetical protein
MGVVVSVAVAPGAHPVPVIAAAISAVASMERGSFIVGSLQLLGLRPARAAGSLSVAVPPGIRCASRESGLTSMCGRSWPGSAPTRLSSF